MARLITTGARRASLLLAIAVLALPGCSNKPAREQSAPLTVPAGDGNSSWDCFPAEQGEYRCQPPAESAEDTSPPAPE